MNLEQVRAHCLALPHVTEQVQWGDALVFKVGGKMFAIGVLEPDATALSFKCSDEDFAELCERPGCIPAPYLARAKWIALETLDALPSRELAARLTKAHALIAAHLPKKTRAALGS